MFEQKKQKFFIGERVLKTGIAIFLTAAVCFMLKLPIIFAAVTALVTLEPTASDSIRKGLIRFPASAIGAAVSIFFVFCFGESPLTFALAATYTLLLCHKLNLNEGALVATITALAMIPDINGNFLLTFLTRLGTTSIGLMISTAVNLFILPPKFMPTIVKNTDKLLQSSAHVFNQSIQKIMNKRDRTLEPIDSYIQLRKEAEKNVQLMQYQREEWKFHRTNTRTMRTYIIAKNKITLLQRIILHIGNLQYIDQSVTFTHEEKKLIIDLSNSITQILFDEKHSIPERHYHSIIDLDRLFQEEEKLNHQPQRYRHHFSPKTIIYYEVLSLHDTLEELERLTHTHHTKREAKKVDNT